jgi:YD repeat-containing protein
MILIGLLLLDFSPPAKAVIAVRVCDSGTYAGWTDARSPGAGVNVSGNCHNEYAFWDEGGSGNSGAGNIGPSGNGSLHTSSNTQSTANQKNSKNPKSPCDGDETASAATATDPIDTSTGSKIEKVTDFAEPGEMGLTFERYYNSRFSCVGSNAPCTTNVGTWTSNLDYKLDLICYSESTGGDPDRPIRCGAVTFTRPDGSSLGFQSTTAFFGTTDGAPVPGPFNAVGTATLTDNGNGTYTVLDENAQALTFDSQGSLLSIKDPSGIGWTLTHPDGNTTIVTHTNGMSFKVALVAGSGGTYGSAKQINVTDPAGGVYVYQSTVGVWDGFTNPVSHLGVVNSETLPGSPDTTISYKYLPDNTVTGSYAQLAEVDYNGVAHDITTYDGAGRANSSSLADGSEKTTIVYGGNGVGPTVTVTNPLGHVTVYQYNGSQLLLSVTGTGNASLHCDASFAQNTYDANGNLVTSADNNGNTTQYVYAATGLLQQKIEAAGTAVQRTTDFTWDTTAGTDRPLSIKVEGLSETDFTYDSNNRLASQTLKDLTGAGTAQQVLTTTYAYTYYPNGMVQTRSVAHPSPGGSNTDVYTYDALGNLAMAANALGHAKTYSNYNALGEPRKMVGPNGDETDYTYDERGRIVTKTTHPNGGSALWAYDYDGFGLPASETDPDGKVTLWNRDTTTMRVSTIVRTDKDGNSTETFGYDANGDVISDVIQRGSDVGLSESASYDGLGRLHQKTGMHGQVLTYGYDGNSNVASVTDAAGHTVSYQYDALNRVVQTSESGGATLGVPVISLSPSSITGSYTIGWNGIDGAASYTLQEQLNGGAWSTAYNGSATSDAISGKADGTYGYRVQACNAGACGGWSSTANVSVLLPPPAPASISVPGTSSGPVAISWAAASTATSYVLQRAVNGGGWNALYTGTATSYSQSETATGSYAYRVQACNSSGCSGYTTSGAVVVTIPPSTASSVSVPSTSSTGSYTVSWGGVAGATSYTLQEQVNGGAWSAAYSGSATSKGFSGKTNGAHYGYRVEGCNAGGCGPWSGTGTVAIAIPPAAPTVVGNDEVQNVNSESITILWSAVSGASRYDLENYSTGSIIYSGTGTSFTPESGVPPLPEYTFAVRACNPYACSGWVIAAIQDVTPAPTGSPTLSLSAGSSQGSYTASWTTLYHASSYTLQEQLNGGAWSTVYNGTATGKAFSGKAVGNYGYQVRGCSDGGCGPWSSAATIAVNNSPPAPTNVHETESGSYKVIWLKVLWDAVGTATRYEVKIDASDTIVYSGTATSYAIASGGIGGDEPDPHTAYVRACNAGGCSVWVLSSAP